MSESKSLTPKSARQFLTTSSPRPAEARQQRLMVGALVLLLAALGLLLYKDRDFWFPGTEEAQDLPEESVPAATNPPMQQTAVARNSAPHDGHASVDVVT